MSEPIPSQRGGECTVRAVIATVGALSMSLAMSPVWVNGSVAAAGATAAIGRWHVTGTMNTARRAATATGLPTGRVLVAGGYGCPPTDVCSSAELYDPRTGKWHPTGGMAMGRAGHTATLLRNGRVLVAGGNGCTPLNVCSTA